MIDDGMARTFEFVLHFVRCVMVTVSPNQIIIIIIIIIIMIAVRGLWQFSLYKDGQREMTGRWQVWARVHEREWERQARSHGGAFWGRAPPLKLSAPPLKIQK